MPNDTKYSLRVILCVYDTIDGRIGGPIAWAMDLIPFLTKCAVQLQVLVLRAETGIGGQVADVCLTCGASVQVLDSSKTVYLDDQVKWILDRCREFRPDVLIANLVLPAFYAAPFLRQAGVTTVAVMHSDPAFDPFYRDVTDVFVRDSDWAPSIVVSVSQAIDKEVARYFTNAPFRREVIPCGCRLPAIKAQAPGKQLKLIYSGRLVVQPKRIRETVEALLRATEMDGVSATICGAGEQQDWVIQRLQGQSRVRYIGQVPPNQLQKVLSEHHVIVLLSDFEGLPIALVEGMAVGLVPVGLTSTSGVNEVVQSEENGLLVTDRGDDFQKAIARLRDRDLWCRLSSAAIQTVQQQYAHDVAFDKWLHLLQSCSNGADALLIPKRVRIPDPGQRFVGYPRLRPTRRQRIASLIDHCVFSIRQFVRPRARIRRIVEQLHSRSRID